MESIELKDIIIATTSILAIIISIFSLYTSYKNSKTAISDNELYIRNLTINACNRIADIGLDYLKFKLKNKEKADDIYIPIIKQSYESLLNIYEKACSLYLDGKVDKERFKKDYKKELSELDECEQTQELIKDSRDYGSLTKVMNDWLDKNSNEY